MFHIRIMCHNMQCEFLYRYLPQNATEKSCKVTDTFLNLFQLYTSKHANRSFMKLPVTPFT